MEVTFNMEKRVRKTPITSKNFFDSIEFRAMDLRRLVGVAFAEGFTVERYLTVNSLGGLK